MSQFRIYQIDHFDPKYVGQNVRRQIILITIVTTTIYIVSATILALLKLNIMLSLFLPAPIFGLLLYRILKLAAKQNKMKSIGEIEFTRSTIKKKIGDSITEYDFQSIEKIELLKHLPAINIFSSLYDNFTYIINIIFYDSQTVSLIVSNFPIDNRINISIVDTIKTLKKFIKAEIEIET